MSSLFASQECAKCGIQFECVEQMDVHMKVVHHETEHQKTERRFEMAAFSANSHKTAKEHSVTESKIWRAEPHLKQKLPDGDDDEKVDNERNWQDEEKMLRMRMSNYTNSSTTPYGFNHLRKS